jgi:4-amino-4-deoxy-L-arabinose transferase-like glycosyltransferase
LPQNSSLNLRRVCFWMVIAALAVRLAVIPFLISEQLNPERDHWRFGYEAGRIARSIVEGRGFGNPLFANTGATAWQTPVYPYIVAGVFKLLGTYTTGSAVALLALNALTSALTCVPIFFFARESFGERVALWSGWGWAFFPYAIYFPEERIWDTWLATLLLCILFLIILRFEKKPRSAWAWTGYGALWGVAALTDPIVLAALLPLGVRLCWRLHKQQRAWFGPNVIAALVFAAVVSPWFVRNYRVFHHFVPFRDNIGLELHVGYNGDTSHWFPRVAGPWHNDSEWNEYMQRGEYAYMADKKRQAIAYIKSHPRFFVWISVRHVVYLWTGYWSFNRAYLQEENLDPENICFCTALTILTLTGLWLAFRCEGAAAVMPYFLVLLFFPLLYYVTHPEDWYRRPIDPFFVVLSAYAVVALRRGSRDSLVESPETSPPAFSGHLN